MDIASLRREFPVLQHCIYLNCGTYGPLPTAVADELIRWYRRIEMEGSFAPEVLQDLHEEYEAARRAAAALLHADPEEIALTRNVSEGVNIVANGLSWQPGDEVILTDEEHPGGACPWLNLARREGIVVKLLPLANDVQVILERLEELITSRTRLVYVSHVSCQSGLRLPVAEICDLAHRKGALVMVDGAHSVGQFPVDVRSLRCDFYAACGHKWICGPQGTGFLYIRREHLSDVEPIFVGWDTPMHFDLQGLAFEPRPDARRFEYSTRPWPLYPALRVALERILALDPAEIERAIIPMAIALKGALIDIPGVKLISPWDPSLSSGLVAFTHTIPGDLGQRLWEEHRILVGANKDRRWVRISVNAYISSEELDLLVCVLRQLAEEAR
ncbi:MAG TPA: aminotransferase class V-fold PLP-dependent enzyme [Caldilineae bacterium]|nr:aminotransferase class V-fold PLP-dependent enzyme [Caldilineae bacterium]